MIHDIEILSDVPSAFALHEELVWQDCGLLKCPMMHLAPEHDQ